MTAKSSDKRKARLVQKTLGTPYSTSLQLVTGELRVRPRSPECVVQAALADVGVPLEEGLNPCTCQRCGP